MFYVAADEPLYAELVPNPFVAMELQETLILEGYHGVEVLDEKMHAVDIQAELSHREEILSKHAG